MFIFVIAVGAVMLPIILGGLLALGTSRLDAVVISSKEEVENKDKGYSLGLTLGHKIKVGLGVEAQLKEARLLGAQKAASIPRGSNMRIGRLGQSTLKTAGKALNEDPWTAVKIAQFHGFDGAKAGTATAAAAGGVGTVTTTAVVVPGGKIKLVPGKDYEFVAIVSSMAGAEKRQARIANAKAKSKAYKAAKAASDAAGGVVVTTTTTTSPVVAAQPVAAVAMPTGIAEPNYIEITDDMSPDDLRKARIHNSKEKSKYNKALKAAGYDPNAVAAGEVEVLAAAAAPTPAPVLVTMAPAIAPAASGAPDPALLASIPAPDYIEMTDSMSPDEVRQARIHNSKARSAYNKALKVAGIDPKSLE